MNKHFEVYGNNIKTFLLFLVSLYAIISYSLKSIVQIIYPYQLEFREAALAHILSLFKIGLNPYTYENLPQSTYVYGIGYPAIVAFFASIFNSDYLFTARLISFLSILLAASLVYVSLNKIFKQKEKALSLALTVSLLILWDQHAGVGAIPTSVSVLIITCSVIVPYLFQFNFIACLCAIVLSLMGYFIKPYCLLSTIFIISYVFLFISIKKGAVLTIITLLISIILVYICQYCFPAYFAVTYYGFACANISSFAHMLSQLKDIFNDFTIVKFFVVMLILILFSYSEHILMFERSNLKWNKGILCFLLNKPLNYFGYCSLLGFMAFATKLGHHAGAFGGGYLTHFFFQFLLLFIASFLSTVNKRYLIEMIILFILFFSSLYMYQSFNQSKKRLRDNAAEVAKIEKELSSYTHIYNSPENTSLMLHLGKEVFNNGQTEFFDDIMNCESPVKLQSQQSLNDFKQNISKKIKTQYFDLILQTHDYFGRNNIDKNELQTYYQLLKTTSTPVGEWGWNTEWWIRK